MIDRLEKESKTLTKGRLLEELDFLLVYDNGLKTIGNQIYFTEVAEFITGILTSYKIKKNNPDLDEAINLVSDDSDKDNLEFYTPERLNQLKNSGQDISKLEPKSNSPFIRKIKDISTIDVKTSYLNGEK